MICVYVGRRGRGKTLTMVKDAYIYYKNGRTIISNMEGLHFPHVYMDNEEIKKLDKNSNIDNVVLLIDELQIFFDSRRSMKKGNIDFSNFVQQIRKRGVDILGTTQFTNSIDKRLRDHTDIIAQPNFIKDFLVCEVTYIDVTSTEDIFSNGIPDSIQTTFDCREVFKLYNTNAMVK